MQSNMQWTAISSVTSNTYSNFSLNGCHYSKKTQNTLSEKQQQQHKCMTWVDDISRAYKMTLHGLEWMSKIKFKLQSLIS